jgi:hypothetical protein
MHGAAAAARPALVTMSQAPAGSLRAVDDFWDDDVQLPVVDPESILKVEKGSNCELPRFNVDTMVAMSEMKMVNSVWVKLLMSLNEREGTVLDVTPTLLGYEDQEALTRVRKGVLDVKTSHVFCAVSGTSTWPTTLAVESWLRDVLVSMGRGRSQTAALKLWSIVLSRAVGEEAIRDVIRATNEWNSFDVYDASCSRGGTGGSAHIAFAEAKLYKEYLWLNVLSCVEQASADSLWDWRRSELACHVHGCGKCENAGKPRIVYVMRCGCKWSGFDVWVES